MTTSFPAKLTHNAGMPHGKWCWTNPNRGDVVKAWGRTKLVHPIQVMWYSLNIVVQLARIDFASIKQMSEMNHVKFGRRKFGQAGKIFMLVAPTVASPVAANELTIFKSIQPLIDQSTIKQSIKQSINQSIRTVNDWLIHRILGCLDLLQTLSIVWSYVFGSLLVHFYTIIEFITINLWVNELID